MKKLAWFGGLGHSRSPAMSPFDTAHTTSYWTLIKTMRLSRTVFELASYLLKVAYFNLHACICRPLWEWRRLNFAQTFGVRKNRVPALSCGVVCLFLRLAVLVEHCDRRTDGRTDKWTDRQTHDNGIYRTNIASRGKNMA